MWVSPFHCEDCPPIPFDILINERVIEEIPYYAPTMKEMLTDGTTKGEYFSFLAAQGHEIWGLVRDRQGDLSWYFGQIQSHGRSDTQFTWLRDQKICCVMKDSSLVCSELIAASIPGGTPLPGKRFNSQVMYLSDGATVRISDLSYSSFESPRTQIWVGFPKGRGRNKWNITDVVELRVVLMDEGGDLARTEEKGR